VMKSSMREGYRIVMIHKPQWQSQAQGLGSWLLSIVEESLGEEARSGRFYRKEMSLSVSKTAR
jgi:hypothetical protein